MQDGDHNVEVWLDRAFRDHGFVNSMSGTTITNLPMVFSNHAALLIEIKEGTDSGSRKGHRSRPFRYEDMWQRYEDYVDFVNQS
jgi:hypothetical protein